MIGPNLMTSAWRRVGPLPAAPLPVPTALLLGAAACGAGADAPAATVTQSGDTTIVVPALDGPTGRLVSDLVIGADESSPDAIFGRIADAAFGPDGEIYVVDSQASRVSVFGRDGAFDGLLSRGGDGPGEVHSPRMIAVGSDGSVGVMSWWEVDIFDPDGEPHATVQMTGWRHPIRFDSAGLLRVHRGPAGPPEFALWRVGGNGVRAIETLNPGEVTPFAIEVLAADGSRRDSIAGPFGLDDLPCPAIPDAPTFRICFFVSYAPMPWFDWLPDGRRLEGWTNVYRIDVRGGDGGGIRSIRPPRAPIPAPAGLSPILADSWTGGPPFDSLFVAPSHVPAIAQVLPTRDGRLLVRLHAEAEPAVDDDGDDILVETESRFDIFTPEGEHQGYVTGPADLTVRDIRGDTVLTTRVGGLGVQVLERFVIDWTRGGA